MLLLSPAAPCSAGDPEASNVLGNGRGLLGSRIAQGSLGLSRSAGCSSSVPWKQHNLVFFSAFMWWPCFWALARVLGSLSG